MAEIFPDLYSDLRKNYASRPDIASLRIPPLANCLWNDVLHMSPVHPARLQKALAEAGHDLPAGWRRFFRIDGRLLKAPDAVIYPPSRTYWTGQFDVAAASEEIGRDCLPFTPPALASFSEVPASAREYYSSVSRGSGLALFIGVPHVLYKGRLDIATEGISIIEV